MNQDRVWLENAVSQPATLDILQWRQKAQSFGSGALSSMGLGRGHPKFRAQTFLKAPGDDAPEALVEGMRTGAESHNRAVLALEELLNRVGGTVKKDVVERTRFLLEAADGIGASHEALTLAVDEFAEWKAGQASVKAASKKKSHVRVGQFLKPMVKGGVPAHLAKYLVSSGYFAAPDGVEESGWPVLTPANIPELKTEDDVAKALDSPSPWCKQPMAFHFLKPVQPGAANCPMCRLWLVVW